VIQQIVGQQAELENYSIATEYFSILMGLIAHHTKIRKIDDLFLID
jgi:hypothetical protein